MDEALERLRSRGPDDRPGLGREELQDALSHARAIDGRVFRVKKRGVVREWNDLQRSLNQLAHLYGLRKV